MQRNRTGWIGYAWTASPLGVLPRIAAAHYNERPAWGPTKRIVHPLWVLDYARSDCGRVRVGSPRAAWIPRGAGIVHLYPPGTPYWEDASRLRGTIREAYAIFAGGEEAGLGRLLRPTRPGRPTPGQRFVRMADPSGRLDAPLREMATAGQTMGEAGFWRAQVALATVLDLFLTAAVAQDDGAFVLPLVGAVSGPQRGIVQDAQEYFRAHLAERITLADVAGHLRMSPSAFSHRYAEESGQSPMAALAGLRIEMAKGLLLRGLKMEVIARHAGFCDAFHLSKAFKNRCGLSPSRFRRDLGRIAARGA